MSKKIYFAGSILGGGNDADIYAKIVTELKSYGTVLTEHVFCQTETNKGKKGKEDKVIHDEDIGWLEESDVLVAEVTQPSLGVGYELGRAVDLEKNILCLFRPTSGKRLSAMIGGAVNGTSFIVKNYKDDEFIDILKHYFS